MWLKARKVIEDWLFAPAPGGSATERLRRLARYPYALGRDLLGGQLNLHAMSLVYATLLALIPLLALSILILRLFDIHRVLGPLVLEFFRPLGPAAPQLTQRVMDFADHVRGGLVGSLGLVLLVWTLLGALMKLEDSFNFLWHVEQPRGLARRTAEYLALLAVGPLLIAAVLYMSRLAQPDSSAPAGVPLLGHALHSAQALIPYLFIGALFAALYTFIPNTRVRWEPALAGGLVAGALWAGLSRIFTRFVINAGHLMLVYAGFALVISALVWTYFGWLILLLGARLSFYVQNPTYLRLGLREMRLSGAESEQLALSIMVLVGRYQLTGKTAPTISTLAEALQLPAVAVARMTAALEAGGLVVESAQERVLPSRDPAQIRLDEILAIARNRTGTWEGLHAHVPRPVAQLCRSLEQTGREYLAERTLRELVDS
ncbi:MAG TPA: YihY/virulence factor BrkB family protein [Steroidobacteraceae bacterium]